VRSLSPESLARRSDHDDAGSAGLQPAGGEGTKSPFEPRSVHTWASPTSRLEAGAPSAKTKGAATKGRPGNVDPALGMLSPEKIGSGSDTP